jgi:class 3 adenylate cyclase
MNKFFDDPNFGAIFLAALSGQPPKSSSLFDTLFPTESLGRLASLHPLLRLPSQPRGSYLKDDLDAEVKKIFREQWSERDGQIVPEPTDLALGNDAVLLDATVLYADMADSTKLVDSYEPEFAAEVYKTYLACAARIIKNQTGVITAYDGDRVMGVFIGKSKNTCAVRAAFKINGAVWDIIKPALKRQYPNTDYDLKPVIDVDTSKLLVGRIGVRNDNDLVWVGRAANYAAKLSSLSDGFTTYITDSVYNIMVDSVKYGGVNKEHMWQELTWTAMDNISIYGSIWKFGV